jgi:hypothetical protein
LLPLQQLETVHLIPLQVMNAISAALEPAHDNGALPQVDVIPAQIASLRDPQTMAVDNQVPPVLVLVFVVIMVFESNYTLFTRILFFCGWNLAVQGDLYQVEPD